MIGVDLSTIALLAHSNKNQVHHLMLPKARELTIKLSTDSLIHPRSMFTALLVPVSSQPRICLPSPPSPFPHLPHTKSPILRLVTMAMGLPVSRDAVAGLWLEKRPRRSERGSELELRRLWPNESRRDELSIQLLRPVSFPVGSLLHYDNDTPRSLPLLTCSNDGWSCRERPSLDWRAGAAY
jgi:hypothetical protein